MESKLTIEQSGTKVWKNEFGRYLRVDGPAIEYTDGRFNWMKDGLLHRLDGPASKTIYGTLYYYMNGIMIDVSSDEEFFRIIKLKSFL